MGGNVERKRLVEVTENDGVKMAIIVSTCENNSVWTIVDGGQPDTPDRGGGGAWGGCH